MNNLSSEQFSEMMRFMRRISLGMPMQGVEHVITSLSPEERDEWKRILISAHDIIKHLDTPDYDEWLKSHEKY